MNRRQFLSHGVTGLVGATTIEPQSVRTTRNPFTLGVASGDPTPTGVVLWTRLAPEPLHGGGMPPIPVLVRWRIAHDAGMRQVVRQGLAVAWPWLAHSVHVEVNGLAPNRWYYYQFATESVESAVGRTRTLP